MSAGRRRSQAAAGLAGIAAAWLLLLLQAGVALAADPTASPAGGDMRTNPSAPGLVGDPLFALAGVVVIGLLAVAATLLAVRLSARR